MIAITKATLYHCTCDACNHTWTTLKLPRACAKCGRTSWNTGGNGKAGRPRKFPISA